MALIAVTGVVVTAAVSWTAWRIDHDNEHRLLQVQTRQAANVLAAAILSIQSPLQTALDIASATRADPQQFTGYLNAYVGPGRLFVSASLWQTTGGTAALVTSIGPLSSTTGGAALVARAMGSPTFDVAPIATAGQQRIGLRPGRCEQLQLCRLCRTGDPGQPAGAGRERLGVR